MVKTQKCKSRISQGDIFRDVEYIEYATEKNGVIELSKIIFPFVIVLTQDCDLAQDTRFRAGSKPAQDKLLLSVLVAPLYNEEHVYNGDQLSELGITMAQISRRNTAGKYLMSNQRPRYHHIQFPCNIEIPNSIIDFKHYFSVNLKYLQSIKCQSRICRVSPLFRESISHRFASFLSRVGLPELADQKALGAVNK